MELALKLEAHRFVRQRPDGVVLDVIGAPLPGGGFVSIYTDITERERNATAMRDQALYLSSVLAHLPQGISVFDEQLRLKCWNQKFLEVLDLPPAGVYPDVAFEDLIRYPAERGDTHELLGAREILHSRLGELGTAELKELHKADARAIELARRHVSDQGCELQIITVNPCSCAASSTPPARLAKKGLTMS